MEPELSKINSELEAIDIELNFCHKKDIVEKSFNSALDRVTQPLGINEPSELAAYTISNMSLNSYSNQTVLDELRYLHSHGKVFENLDSMLLTQAVVLNRLFHHSISSNNSQTAIKASEACRKVVNTLNKNKHRLEKPNLRFCEKRYLNEMGQRITEYFDHQGDLVTLIE